VLKSSLDSVNFKTYGPVMGLIGQASSVKVALQVEFNMFVYNSAISVVSMIVLGVFGMTNWRFSVPSGLATFSRIQGAFDKLG
jgi:uncharacterized protein YacL